ncbi:MAG: hypothetical protein JJT81_05850 [Rubellimicrobium sp.]|nr:hypothetical protein [Rubellimicrobium sp.]
MSDDRRKYGEPFLCAPGMRIESHEKLAALQFAQMNAHMVRIEAAMERLEKRLWLAVYGVASVVLAQAVFALLARAT